MRFLQPLFLWASGYSCGVSRRASDEDKEHLGKTGMVIWFVALWTAVMWATASFSFTGAQSTEVRHWAAAGFAIAGAAFVLTFDRFVVYALDSRLQGRWAIAWLLFRVLVILAFGAFTSERLYPFVMKAELQYQALHEREASDLRRTKSLNALHQTETLGAAATQAGDEVKRLEVALATTPPSIQAQLSKAVSCRREVQQVRARLLAQGVARDVVAQRLTGRVRTCQALSSAANSALAKYRADTSEKLTAGRQLATASQTAHVAALSEVSSSVKAAQAIERTAVTEDSILVLWRLVLCNPAAAFKAGAMLVIMLAVELLPFAAKAMLGQTELGVRLAAAREAGALDARTRLTARKEEATIAVATSQATSAAMQAALENPRMRAFLERLAMAQAMGMAPVDIAVRTLRTAEAQKRELDSIAARSPDLAPLAFKLWAKAIREAGASVDAEDVWGDDPQPAPA